MLYNTNVCSCFKIELKSNITFGLSGRVLYITDIKIKETS